MSEKLKKQINTFMKLSCLQQEKSTFIKNKELHNFNHISNDQFKMNKIINKFLLTGDKFMPELHLKHLGFTYSACELNIVKEFKNLEKQVI